MIVAGLYETMVLSTKVLTILSENISKPASVNINSILNKCKDTSGNTFSKLDHNQTILSPNIDPKQFYETLHSKFEGNLNNSIGSHNNNKASSNKSANNLNPNPSSYPNSNLNSNQCNNQSPNPNVKSVQINLNPSIKLNQKRIIKSNKSLKSLQTVKNEYFHYTYTKIVVPQYSIRCLNINQNQFP